MILTKIEDLTTHLDGCTLSAGIQVLAGSLTQTYYKTTGTFDDDRGGIPCLLMPMVSVYDPTGVMSGNAAVISADWYEGPVKPENKIGSSTTGYTLSAAGKPQYSLLVSKNFDVDNPTSINCVFSFTDKRTGKAVLVERSVDFSSVLYTDYDYSVKTDKPSRFSVNPLAQPATTSPWSQVLTAQLYNGTTPVGTDHAAYFWEKLDGTTWRAFNADELAIYATVADNVLTLDARFFTKESVRVKACYYEDEKPTVATNAYLIANNTIVVDMPQMLSFKTHQKSGARLDYRMNNTVDFYIEMFYNNTLVTNKDDLYRAKWYIKSTKIGSSEIFVGEGKTISFNPSKYGVDPLYTVEVYAKVSIYKVLALVTNDEGKVLTTNSQAITTKVFI